MDCYACDKQAARRCPRCSNPYCDDHGADLCADCLSPVNAAPSGTVFRVSLLALLVGSVIALWFLIRPPGLPGESSTIIAPDTPSSPGPVEPSPVIPSPLAETATPSPAPEETPPPPEPTPTPTPEPEPEGPIEYVVQDGDTIAGIAEFFGVDYFDLLAVNGLTEEDAAFIQPGDVLVIP
jgi:LysM repeat protein